MTFDLTTIEQLEAVLSRSAGRQLTISSAETERTDDGFGGKNGVKTALSVCTVEHGQFRIFLKRTVGRFNHEAEIWEHVASLQAPVPQYHGYIDHPTNGRRTMVLEYLPIQHIWPIPPSYHLAWARCSARLCSVPYRSIPVPNPAWPPMHDATMTDAEAVLSMNDPVLRKAFACHGLESLPKMLEGKLEAILSIAGDLPKSFTQSQLFMDHVAQREGDTEVLCFDFAEGLVAPRFLDFTCVIIDHGEPYETSIQRIAHEFHREYLGTSGLSLPSEEFLSEVQFTRALFALWKMGMMVRFVSRQLEDPAQFRTPLWSGPRKWVLLHLIAIRDYLGHRRAIRHLETGPPLL